MSSPPNLQVLSLVAPTTDENSLTATFRPCDEQLFKNNTSVAFSLHCGVTEIYLDRITKRELEFLDGGIVKAKMENVPRIQERTAGDNVEVKVHLWRGEKLLGGYDAGRY